MRIEEKETSDERFYALAIINIGMKFVDLWIVFFVSVTVQN